LFSAALFVSSQHSTTGASFGPYQVVRTLPNPGLDIGGLAYYGGYLYSVEQTYANIHQIDPLTGQVLASWSVSGFYPPSEVPTGLVYDGVSLWLSTRGQENNLRRLSLGIPPNVSFTAQHGLSGWQMDLAYVNGNFMSPEYFGPIRTIDPSTGVIIGSISSPSETIFGLTFDGTALIAGDGFSGTLWRISPQDGTVLDSWQTEGSNSRGLAYDLTSKALFIGGGSSGIMVAQLPEPGTVALTILGFMLFQVRNRLKA